ncbi:MAG: alpha/beta fold hydrolase [Roseiflexaceae bacterium]|nr:alpha/beta fold hydrolase [Roseiflexaceae bacterium]
MPFVNIDGQQVHFLEEGPAGAPKALLIHGWSSSSFTWAPILPSLRKRYRCLAIDLPGYGKSPAPVEPPTIAGYAHLAGRIIEKVSDRPMLVLGHSMGGQITATLALQAPDLLERMVLLNPALSGRLSPRVNMLLAPHVLAERYPFLEWLIYLLAQTPLDYTDYLLKPSSFAERAHVNATDYARIRADARRRGQGRIRALCFGAMIEGDLRGKLRRIETPALVVWGAEDNIVPLRDAGAVADEWPRADLRIIPNAGHWPQFEQPGVTLRHIAHYLGLPPDLDAAADPYQEMPDIQVTAQFLNNCELGSMLNEAQRLRLASIVHVDRYSPGEVVARADTSGDELYMVRDGMLEVWLPARADVGQGTPATCLATMQRGQVVGELALLDNAPRSANLLAGPEGATVLTLTRAALETLAGDDPQMGMLMMQNLAVSLGRRLRNQNWRAARAEDPALKRRAN